MIDVAGVSQRWSSCVLSEEYKVETLRAVKVSWQADPRFQDSSSEEEEAADEDQITAAEATR